MADAATPEDIAPPKSSKMPIILGLVLAILGGGGGFYASWSGLILNSESHDEAIEEHTESSGPTVAFVPIEPLTVSLPSNSNYKYLRFRAELEVAKNYASEVEAVTPRVVDVLNGYLRALELADLQDPSALTRLRAQMLRRVQIVTGPDRVNDLLIMEFVLN